MNVHCESDVFKAVVRWIGYNERERLGKFENLLSAVRCHFLTPRFIMEQLQECALLFRAPNCRDRLVQALEDLQLHKRVKERRRNPPIPQVIYCVGGHCRWSLNTVECFNVTRNEWRQLAPLPVARNGVAVCTMEGLVYVVGGRSTPQTPNDIRAYTDLPAVHAYDPQTNIWRQCT